ISIGFQSNLVSYTDIVNSQVISSKNEYKLVQSISDIINSGTNDHGCRAEFYRNELKIFGYWDWDIDDEFKIIFSSIDYEITTNNEYFRNGHRGEKYHIFSKDSNPA